MNPATLKTDVSNLEVSEILKTTDVNSAVTSIVKLENIEKNIYQVLLAQYNHKIFVYDQKMLVLQNLCTFIQRMIFQIYLCYIFNTENVYEMLTALKNRVMLTDLTRKMKLSNYYQKMKKILKTQHIKIWLHEWEKIYTNYKTLALSDIINDQLLHDFLHAVSDISLSFCDRWKIEIQKKQMKRKTLSDLYKILKFFQNDHQLIMTQKSNFCEIFSFFYQEKLLDNDNKNSEKNSNTTANISVTIISNFKDKKICICELKHQFWTCYYLIKSL